MLEWFKKKVAERSSASNSTRGILMLLIGAYIGYLGITMPQDVKSGASSMSMGLSVFWMIIMLLIGIFVAAYGGFIFYFGWQRQKSGYESDEKERLAENTVKQNPTETEKNNEIET